VIATIPFDLLFCTLCGLVLAYSARALIRAHTGSFFECAALRVTAVYTGLVVWPAALYFYFAHPDWSWMYWVDPHRVPKLTVVLVLIAYAGTLIGGFAGGYALVRAGKFTQLFGAMGGVAVLIVLVISLLHRRFFHWGTYDDYRGNGPMYALGQVKLGYSLIVVGVATTAALGYACWQLHLAGRRIS
jgi:hypothetical protein